MFLYVIARGTTDPVAEESLPAAARLGLGTVVLTDEPDTHVAACAHAAHAPSLVQRCDVDRHSKIATAVRGIGAANGVVGSSDRLQMPTALASSLLDLPTKDWRHALSEHPAPDLADLPTEANGVDPMAAAELAASHGLFGCLTRELAQPERQLVVTEDGWVVLRLARLGETLRARVARLSCVGLHRFSGQPQRRTPKGWRSVDSVALAALIGAELEERSGVNNPEFVDQVTHSRDTIAFLLTERPATSVPLLPDSSISRYVASEQALVYGHPLHPTPKWRTGDIDTWSAYSPELHSVLRLRWLAIPTHHVVEDAISGGGFDNHAVISTPPELPDVPEGHCALPVHPWQWKLITSGVVGRRVAAAVADGTFVDLGPRCPDALPTASVRTLYLPSVDVFLKPSLHIRITNCLRKNAWYELRGAVLLTRKLAPVAAQYAAEFEGRFALMPEPAYRTIDPAEWGVEAAEALGVIVREGLRPHLGPGETPLLAAALASADPEHGVAALLSGHDPLVWWSQYVRLLVPPVLRLWKEHGVVVEPHLQNVLAVVDHTGLPVRMLIRDMEGVKLLAEQHSGYLNAIHPDIAANVGYRAERAWDRLSYCLFVNHLATLAGTIADAIPGLETELWQITRAVIVEAAERLGGSPFLRSLLDGAPLPVKTMLLARWFRQADRQVDYVGMPNPLGAPIAVP